MTAVALECVSKRFGNVQAVEDIRFDAAPGQRVVLIGPSGCGKTTVLRLVAGLERPDRGSIRFDGRPADGLPPRDRDVAMVFQRGALYPHWSVARNLAFPLRLRNVPSAERQRRVAWAAALLGIEPLLDRLPRQLSGGEQQRVALGRALVRRPRVFLLDEPLASLDPALRHQLCREILALHGQLGTTMIYVTHDRAEALAIAQRLVVLRHGRVEQVGTPEEVYHHPATRAVADLLGRRPVNVVHAVVTSVAGQPALRVPEFDGPFPVPLDWPPAQALPADGTVDIVFRPEHASIPAGGTAPDGVIVPGVVETVEPLGDEAFVTLRAGPLRLAGRWSGFCSLAPGDAATLGIDRRRLMICPKPNDAS